MLTKITIAKRKDVSVATKPTHDLVASDDNYQNKTIIGSLWTKVSPDGNKFLSGSIQQPRTHEGKSYDGYVIITRKEYDRLKGEDQGALSPEEISRLNDTNSLNIDGVRKKIDDDLDF